jgi:hypothetical protein
MYVKTATVYDNPDVMLCDIKLFELQIWMGGYACFQRKQLDKSLSNFVFDKQINIEIMQAVFLLLWGTTNSKHIKL